MASPSPVPRTFGNQNTQDWRDITEKMKSPFVSACFARLPSTHDFQIPTLALKLTRNKAHFVGLQFPEGFIAYANDIAAILEHVCGIDCVILGDVAYGACCIEDATAEALGCDILVHFGHSALVNASLSSTKIYYIPVTIEFDTNAFSTKLISAFDGDKRITLVSTVQFTKGIREVSAKEEVERHFRPAGGIRIPICSPLGAGEILGCTAPVLDDVDAVIYVGDGRFHLESIAMAQDSVEIYAYSPYTGVLSREYHDYERMLEDRRHILNQAASISKLKLKSKPNAECVWGVVFGTLGRQGAPRVLKNIESALIAKKQKYSIFYLNEISPSKLSSFSKVDIWVEIACPRLAIDWGRAFDAPLLSPFEALMFLNHLNMNDTSFDWLDPYPTDHYLKPPSAWGSWGYRGGGDELD